MGKDAADANARRLAKEAELNARAHGVPIAEPESSEGKRSISVAITDFLAEIERSKKLKTFAAYRKSLEYFAQSCKREFLEDITREDLLDFADFLRKQKVGDGKFADRTVWNRFNNTQSFLKASGVKGLVSKNDWPKFTEPEPEIYEQEELDKLFAACDADSMRFLKLSKKRSSSGQSLVINVESASPASAET